MSWKNSRLIYEETTLFFYHGHANARKAELLLRFKYEISYFSWKLSQKRFYRAISLRQKKWKRLFQKENLKKKNWHGWLYREWKVQTTLCLAFHSSAFHFSSFVNFEVYWLKGLESELFSSACQFESSVLGTLFLSFVGHFDIQFKMVTLVALVILTNLVTLAILVILVILVI